MGATSAALLGVVDNRPADQALLGIEFWKRLGSNPRLCGLEEHAWPEEPSQYGYGFFNDTYWKNSDNYRDPYERECCTRCQAPRR